MINAKQINPYIAKLERLLNKMKYDILDNQKHYHEQARKDSNLALHRIRQMLELIECPNHKYLKQDGWEYCPKCRRSLSFI